MNACLHKVFIMSQVVSFKQVLPCLFLSAFECSYLSAEVLELGETSFVIYTISVKCEMYLTRLCWSLGGKLIVACWEGAYIIYIIYNIHCLHEAHFSNKHVQVYANVCSYWASFLWSVKVSLILGGSNYDEGNWIKHFRLSCELPGCVCSVFSLKKKKNPV